MANGGVVWKCGHARRPTNSWLGTWSSDQLKYWAEGAASERGRQMCRDELAARRRSCPGCTVQNRRNRRHWSALAVAAALLLLVAWRCR